MASNNKPSYCGVCSRNLDEEVLQDGEFMIQCDICETWYHGRCVELEEYEAADIDNYHCPSCFSKAGPSQPKVVRNNHRYDYSDPDAADKPTENGTKRFVEQLLRRKFLDAASVVEILEDGRALTGAYLAATNFRRPISVENVAGLGLTLPPTPLAADDVEKCVGGDRYVDVIDVYSQHSYKMRLRSFLNFFRQRDRPKLYNLISLEFSDTELSKLVKPPDVVQELSWVEQFWPKPLRDDLSSAQKAVLNEHIAVRPEVSKFCLIGMAGSYTDFHVDFGGTSVFYHVLWGEKIFYLIEPSEKNLALFEYWQQSLGYSERFFGDIVSDCYRLALKPGQTLLIPTGWIHAVYTPEDSLVIGGNFLHSFNIGLQIRIYEMEKRANTADKFMFPHFELVNWYAGVHFLDTLKELNDEKTPAKPYLLEGLKALVAGMKTWVQRNQSSTWPLANVARSKVVGQIVIETMTCSQVLKQLEKAVRINEKLATPSQRGRGKRSNVLTGIERPLTVRVPKQPPVASSSNAKAAVPKAKICARHTIERSKGCPKSPAKIQQHADDADVAADASRVKRSGETTSSSLSLNERCPMPELERQCSDMVRNWSGSAAALDSAPPTPRWSDDPDESGDRSLNNTVEPIAEATKGERTTREKRPHLAKPGTSADAARPSTTSSDDLDDSGSGKRMFGFSLLDMRSDPTSPSPPECKRKDLGRAPSSSVVSPPVKQELRVSFSDQSLATSPTASHSQKPNQRLAGKAAASNKLEYFSGLGYCRQDDEFVYPSLSDSESPETGTKKRRKAPPDQSPKKTKDGATKSGKSKTPRPSDAAADEPPTTLDIVAVESNSPKARVDAAKPSPLGSGKVKKAHKGTTKQRLANKLKIRKLIPM